MPLASLSCRYARFDDEGLNQKVKIATLKNKSVQCFQVIRLIMAYRDTYLRLLFKTKTGKFQRRNSKTFLRGAENFCTLRHEKTAYKSKTEKFWRGIL